MLESMYKFMKVGLVHSMAYPETSKGEGPILKTLEEIAEDDFFTAVEVTHIKNTKVKEKVREVLQTAGLVVSYGAQPLLLSNNLDLNSPDENHRKKAVTKMKEGVDEAYEMGAIEVAILSGKDPGKGKRQKTIELLVDSINQICEYAKSKGEIKVILEIFDQTIDKKCLIGPTNYAREVAEKVKKEHSNFGLMVDLSHLPLLNETPTQAIVPIKDFLVHAHIGNCVLKDKNHPAYGDQHPRFGIPGGENGVDEVVAFLKVLLDVGFLNPGNPPIVSFEVKPMVGERSKTLIANAKRTLREAWIRIEGD